MIRSLFLITTAIVFYGCSIHPKPLESNLKLPKEFSTATDNVTNIPALWWENFNSTVLNSLIKKAHDNSPDILIAYENIEQARLQLGISEVSYLPTASLSAGTSGSRSDASGRDASTSKSTSASIRISYEIDLWGKIRANKEAALAKFDATVYDKDALTLSMYATVAESYFSLLSYKERLAIAKNNLNISEQLMKIVEAKYKSGSVSLLDVSRQKSSLLSQQANVKSLELQEAQAKNALATLTGNLPQEFEIDTDSLWDLSIPKVEAGLPSELLLNRPDIAKAKANVAAANAAVRSANADRFPSFSLSGNGGISSSALASFKDPTSVLSLALNAAYTLFDSGRLNDLKDIEISRTKSVIQNYNKVILTALQESDDALLSVAHQSSLANLQNEIVEESSRSLDIASLQYKYGSSDLTTLLDAQNKYFSSKDAQASQRLNHLKSLVSLYKVLGGGWSSDINRAL
ncbi:MAG: efflux transporter outer membrane subunit [Campylobacteraceae bacterium]|jgi:NodT family efflux transporter outer membrane factor (OMF) lipoprotein|nr:efflux transporter outer membrane subunit [Campylobacteraceae bacterium]